jgi:hypothetical protein
MKFSTKDLVNSLAQSAQANPQQTQVSNPLGDFVNSAMGAVGNAAKGVGQFLQQNPTVVTPGGAASYIDQQISKTPMGQAFQQGMDSNSSPDAFVADQNNHKYGQSWTSPTDLAHGAGQIVGSPVAMGFGVPEELASGVGQMAEDLPKVAGYVGAKGAEMGGQISKEAAALGQDLTAGTREAQAGFLKSPFAAKEVPKTAEEIANSKRIIKLNGTSIKSGEDVAAINNDYNTYGGNGTINDQITKAFGKDGAVSKLAGQAEAQVGAEGGSSSRDKIDNLVLNKLKGNVTPSQIGAKDLQTGIQEYTDGIYNRAVGGNATPVSTKIPGSGIFTPTTSWQELPKGVGNLPSEGGLENWTDPTSGKAYVRWDTPPKEPIPVQSQTTTRLTPDNVPDLVKQKMARFMNQDAASTYIQTDPTKWNRDQIIARNARDTFADDINTAHPGVAKINKSISNLYKGYENGLMDQANSETVAGTKPTTVKDPGGVGKTVGNIVKGSIGLGIGVPASVAGIMGGLNVLNPGTPPSKDAITPQPKSGSSPTSSSELQTDFNTMPKDSNGNAVLTNIYGLKSENGVAQIMSPGQRDGYLAKLAKVAADNPGNTAIQDQVTTATGVINKAYDNQQSVRESYNQASFIKDKILDAKNILNSNMGALGGPNPLDALPGVVGGTVEKFQGGVNAKYKQLLQDFASIQSYPGLNLDLTNIGTSDVAKQTLEAAQNKIAADVNKKAKAYFGSSGSGTESSTIAPSPAPVVTPTGSSTGTTQQMGGSTYNKNLASPLFQ